MNSSPQPAPTPATRGVVFRLACEVTLVAALSTLAVIAQLRWVTQYREGPEADYAMHMADAAGFASIMNGNGHLTEKLVAAWAWPDLYASGTYAVSYLLRPITGASELGLLESLNFFLPIAVIGAYLLGRAAACPVSGGPQRPAAGMAIGATAAALLIADPRFILTTRRYWVDMPQTAMIVISLAALVYSDGLRRRGWSVAFGLAFGLALLVKYTAVWFIGLPMVACMVWGLWRERPTRRLLFEFASAGAVVAVCLMALASVSLRHQVYMVDAGDLTPPLTFELLFGCTACALLWATFAWYRLRGVTAHATFAMALCVLLAAPWALVNRFIIAERWRATAMQMPQFQQQFGHSLYVLGESLSWWSMILIALGFVAALVWPSRRPSMGLVLLAVASGLFTTLMVLGYADRYLAPITALFAVLAVAWIPPTPWLAWPLFVLSLGAPYMMLFGYPPGVDVALEDVVTRHFAGTVANLRAMVPRDTEPAARAIHERLRGIRSVCILSPRDPIEKRDEMVALLYVLTAVENWSADPARVELGVLEGGQVERIDLLPLQPLRLRTLAAWRGEADLEQWPAGASYGVPQAVVLPSDQPSPEQVAQQSFGGFWRRVPLDDDGVVLLFSENVPPTSTR